MRDAVLSATVFLTGDQRLTAASYVSADQQAHTFIADFDHADALVDVCQPNGLFRGPMFRRIFTPDASFGRPYVTATDLEQAEVRPAVHLSNLHGALLDRLALQEDSIVVSRSGVNLGKSFYVRPDLAAFVGSDDLIRVLPDPSRIAPGYLFAYLDSRFGRVALRHSTHGGSVRHIEPAGIAGLRVPRLSGDVERRVDDLVRSAGVLLSKQGRALDDATLAIESAAGLAQLAPVESGDDAQLGWTERTVGEASLRALNFDPRAQRVRQQLEGGSHDRLGDLCDPAYFRGKQIFRREDASDSEGVLLLGQRGAFRLRPEGRTLSRRSVERHRLRVPAGTVLIPSHGTLGVRELYCRALVVTSGMAGYAYSGDFFRCVPLPEKVPAGYLYAFLRSRHAFRLLRSISSGGKQQELSVQRMSDLPVPRIGAGEEIRISQIVEEASVDYDEAVRRLNQARHEVESAIDEGQPKS